MSLLLQHASTLFNTSCVMAGHWRSEVFVIAAAIVICCAVPNVYKMTLFPDGLVVETDLFLHGQCSSNQPSDHWSQYEVISLFTQHSFLKPIHLLLTTTCYSGSRGCWALSPSIHWVWVKNSPWTGPSQQTQSYFKILSLTSLIRSRPWYYHFNGYQQMLFTWQGSGAHQICLFHNFTSFEIKPVSCCFSLCVDLSRHSFHSGESESWNHFFYI